MAVHLVNMGVYAKDRLNVDSWWNRSSKKCICSKVMTKTKYLRKMEPKMADFLCILVRNLKRPALNQFYSNPHQFFCGGLLCIFTCYPSLGIKSSIFFEFRHTLLGIFCYHNFHISIIIYHFKSCLNVIYFTIFASNAF